jgi:S-methylmethionine-dependent homocysteine/selenocysteine methylase
LQRQSTTRAAEWRWKLHFAELNVDLFYAPTFPAFSKLSGVARDMAKTGWPYALAPMLHPNGTMLDATPLAGAIVRIDVEIVPTPQHYMIVGCLYPTHAQTALQALCTTRLDFVKSVRGLRRTPHPPARRARQTESSRGDRCSDLGTG